VLKGWNNFWGQKLANTCNFVGECIIVQQEKVSRTESSWTNPLNALQETIHYSFIIFCIYCLSLWYEFFVHHALRVEKIISMFLMRDLWNFSFLNRGDISPTHSQLCRFISGSQAKHRVLFPVIILLKKFVCIGHRDVVGRCDSIFPLLRCQEVWKKRAHNFLFPKSFFIIRRTTVLVMCKDSAIILDEIRRSFLLNRQRQQYLLQFESILDGHISRHLLPDPFRLEIENTT